MKTLKLLFFSFLIALTVSAISCKKEISSPTDTFSYSPNPGKAGSGIQFNYTGTGATSFSWTFGDNAGSASSQNPVYTYANPGFYTVTLTVSNAGGSATTSQTITVTQ
ncbi:MAG TPA: PKD domain-containing protein [Bacteroidia bacterium]|jgi:PKD repeat protein|nr:PKD domain-containing protein [Bacteroidia bacterium]